MIPPLSREDRTLLIEHPAFRRFLVDVIQRCGLFSATANGSDGRNLYLEGRRSLGLEVLEMMDEVQPVQNPSGIPVLTLIQLLREAAQGTPKEKPVGRRSDQYADLGDDDGNAVE